MQPIKSSRTVKYKNRNKKILKKFKWNYSCHILIGWSYEKCSPQRVGNYAYYMKFLKCWISRRKCSGKKLLLTHLYKIICKLVTMYISKIKAAQISNEIICSKSLIKTLFHVLSCNLNAFKVNNNEIRTTSLDLVLVSSFLTWNTFTALI